MGGFAAIAFVLVIALGRAVGHVPDPAWIMTDEASWVNHGTAVAWSLTQLGLFKVLFPLAVVLAIVACFVAAWRSRLIFGILFLAIAWRSTDLLQHLFARPRRLDWVVYHETSFSYPSSHTAVAATFFLMLAVFVYRSALRGRVWVVAAFVLLALGVMWSRLALGAHYLTDIAGGLLWGSALVAALAACWPTNVFEGRARRTLE